jgi:hypothetical protein
MSQPLPPETIDYERFVDGLRKVNAEMVRALELHHASHVAFEHGDDVESKKQYALAVEATRSIVRESNGVVKSQTSSKTIVVHVEGGLVQDVIGIPAGCEVRVEDHDEGDTSHPSWDAEKECFVTVYGGEGV